MPQSQQAAKDARRWLIRTAITQPDQSIDALKAELGVDHLYIVPVNSFEELLEMWAEGPDIRPN